jgi:hypothetical protein
MAIELLQTVTKAENSSGDIGVYTVKVKEGYAMVQNPDILTIDGDEWDLTGDNTPVSITTGSDHREADGNGNGIHGTQTFNINLEYAAGNLNPSDDNTNEITLNLHVEKIKYLCANTSEYIVMRGGVPSFNFFQPITNYSATTFYGSNPLYLALAQQTYTWYIDSEDDAFCLHTSGTGLSMTGQYSKTVNVSTSVYTGTKTIYWGDITVTCSGDFGTASMIFDDGLRSTKDWIRHEDSCVVSYTSASSFAIEDFDGVNVIKVDDCEYISTGATTLYSEVAHSKTNGYNFALKKESSNPLTTIYSKKENNIYLSMVREGVVGQGTLARSIDGTNFTICLFNPSLDQMTNAFYATDEAEFLSLGYLAAFRRQVNIQDFCYAGEDSSGNHVWYALCCIVDTSNIIGPGNSSYVGKPFLAKSTDNAASFTTLSFDETKAGNSDFFGGVAMNTASNGPFAPSKDKIYASLEYNYLFVSRIIAFQTPDVNGVNTSKFGLFRHFPSQDNNTTNDDCQLKPVLSGNNNNDVFNYLTSTHAQWLDHSLIEDNIPFLILNNGFCIYPGYLQYAVSWNYGINWAIASYPTITATHATTNDTYTYPSNHPAPYEENGNIFVVTGSASRDHRNTPYRQGVNGGQTTTTFGLFDAFMRINIKGENTLLGGTVPSSWTDSSSQSVNVSDIVEDWTLLKQYDYSTSFGVKKVSDVFVDSEQNRKFISHGNQTLVSGTQPGTGLTLPPQAFGLTVLPPAATPTISNTGIFTTITTPTLPSGTTLTQASANQGYYYEVYSDSPFSIVFTTGNGVQRKFDGVFDIVVLSKTLPVVLDTVSNQQYTTYQGVFDMGDAPTSSVPNPPDNGTLVSGSFGTSGLTQRGYLGHYIIRDAFLYYGFIPKVYVNGFWRTDPQGSDSNAATNLKKYSRTDLTVGDRPSQVASGQSIEYLFDPANGPILTTPSGYTFTHILGMYSGGTTLGTGNSDYRSINGSLPLYGDVIFCFPKRNSDGYTVPTFFNGNTSSNIFTNSGDINTIGLKFYSDYTGTGFISGYYGSRNTEEASVYRRINPDSSVQLDFEDKYNKNYIHINSDGFVDEVGDVASLPNYDQCN